MGIDVTIGYEIIKRSGAKALEAISCSFAG
jgi:hypothetical protein